jgi:outer membrane protein assembly factor BamB
MVNAVKKCLLFLFIFCAVIRAPLTAEPREPLWRFITGGRIRSFPAVGRDGNVYLLSDDRFLYSLTPAGEQRWRYYLEERLTDSFAVGYDGMIYIGYKTGELIAVHGYGQKVWQYDTGESIRLSPAVRRDGSVCLATEQGTLFAVSHTGVLLWKLSLPGKPASAPVADSDNSLYIALTNGTLAAIHPWGELRWRLRLSGVPSYPALDNQGTIYVGTQAGSFYAIDPLPKIRWRRSFRGSLLPAVIGQGNILYIITSSGELATVSREGELVWSLPLGEIPSGPCVLGDTGTIFVATRSSTLWAIDPMGGIKWSIKAKGVLTQLMLSPQGILYAGSSDWAVYAFPGEKLAAAPWPAFRHDVSHTGASGRDYNPLTIEKRYARNPDFLYFQSLLFSGDADLMQQGLAEIRNMLDKNDLKEKRPYLLHFLRKIAGFTVIEEDRQVRFPLRGFTPIREESCRLYTDIGGFEAYPLLLRILKHDQDYTMKAVAVRCLGRLESDPNGEAVRTMALLISADTSREPNNTFAREVIIALRNISRYHGHLSPEGVKILLVLSNGTWNKQVRTLAKTALTDLSKGK